MENSELKTKKMSLANIEGKLSVAEMEQIMAGSGDWDWPSAECLADCGLSALVGGMWGGPWGYGLSFAYAYYASPRC